MNRVTISDKELEAYGKQYACNVLQSLMDETCNNCRGADVRESMAARKRKLELEIEQIDGEINRP